MPGFGEYEQKTQGIRTIPVVRLNAVLAAGRHRLSRSLLAGARERSLSGRISVS